MAAMEAALGFLIAGIEVALGSIIAITEGTAIVMIPPDPARIHYASKPSWQSKTCRHSRVIPKLHTDMKSPAVPGLQGPPLLALL